MKYILTILNTPLVVFFSSLVGVAATYYLQEVGSQVVLWFVPCLAIIIADLAAGLNAAKGRGERIRISTALRRTSNKMVCYGSLILACVALNERYCTGFVAWVGIGIVFLIEGFSFFTNILEPHGLKLSVGGLLRIIGSKTKVEGLEGIVEKKNEDGQKGDN